MRTILVTTDFSPAADNAAHYATQLAKTLRTNIKLCNAIRVIPEGFSTETLVWPLEDYDSLKKSITAELKTVCDKLQRDKDNTTGDHTFPKITFTSQVGDLTEVVKDIVDIGRIPLVVMGMSGAGALSRLFLGSNSDDMIDKAHFPLLLIPHDVTFKVIHKIAFATDLNPHDLEVIYSMAAFARNFNAEILIAHITDEKYDAPAHQKKVDNFLSDVTCKANYGKIYYRHVKSIDVEHGLDWICQHSFSDMIVMSHGKHNFIDAFFNGSHTKKLARHVNIPMMVYPKHVRSSALIAF
jgi:nucleotide-binding universal stress UspA family protein